MCVASGLAQGRIGYFRTSSHAGPTTPDQDWIYLSTRGSGKFVGDTVDMIGPASRQYLEGDERAYIDGVHSPQIHVTGTEDYYGSGFFFNRGPYSTALHDNSAHLTSHTGCAKDKDCTSAFRLMLAEAVPYGSRLEFGIEHGGADDVSATYSSTAYYYGAAHNSLYQSDLLRVGDAGSKVQHHYSSPDPGPVQQLSAAYEGVDGPRRRSHRIFENTTSAVTFTLKLDPSNAGAMLVRTSDQQQGYVLRGEQENQSPFSYETGHARESQGSCLLLALVPVVVAVGGDAPVDGLVVVGPQLGPAARGRVGRHRRRGPPRRPWPRPVARR